MLTFSITIGPDKEDPGEASLALNIIGDGLFVFVNGGLSLGLEEVTRRARSPIFVLGIEIQAGEMAQHAGHDYGTAAPLSKIEVKLVVFHILTSIDSTLQRNQKASERTSNHEPTVLIRPPARC